MQVRPPKDHRRVAPMAATPGLRCRSGSWPWCRRWEEAKARTRCRSALDRYRALASLVGLIIEAKASYSGDVYAQTQRSREMALQAELIWAFLPLRTLATDRVLVSVSLEPAYEAGGVARKPAR
jgi:hypothetical protein